MCAFLQKRKDRPTATVELSCRSLASILPPETVWELLVPTGEMISFAVSARGRSKLSSGQDLGYLLRKLFNLRRHGAQFCFFFDSDVRLRCLFFFDRMLVTQRALPGRSGEKCPLRTWQKEVVLQTRCCVLWILLGIMVV